MKRRALTAERAHELLRYEPETGQFYWRVARGGIRCAGASAGFIDRRECPRYWKIRIDRRTYFAHRLAWLMMTGEWPSLQVDHINGDGFDNRWANLREVTNQENQQNAKLPRDNSSGAPGVWWNKARKQWYAQIGSREHRRRLGQFDRLEDAVAARKAAERELGYHPNHGRKAG